MEIKYPYLILITIIFIIAVILIFRRKKRNYSKGSIISNTKYVKNTSYYKDLFIRYKIITILLLFIVSGVLIANAVLTARVQEIKENSDTDYNRDIMLCMDVSGSVSSLNMSLVNQLRDVVNGLQGDRFGVTIFNSTAITIVPLTKDYKYVDKILDTVSRSFNAQINGDYKTDKYIYNYIYQGTTEGDRGYSLIPDGLMSCGLTFKESEENRTRVIIMSTDNSLAGTAVFNLEEAAQYLKDNNIILYGIGTNFMYGKNLTEYKRAVNITGGKYFNPNRSSMSKVVKEIDGLSKAAVEVNAESYRTDRPESIFIVLVLLISLLFIITRQVKI